MRTRNPEQRKLNVRWSTHRWVPHIVFAPARNGTRGCEMAAGLAGGLGLFGKMIARRRQGTMLWGRDGTRTTWR